MTNAPNKDRIKLWIAALRSGSFKQGYGALRPTKDTWCCLGVACEVARNVDPTIGKWVYTRYTQTGFLSQPGFLFGTDDDRELSGLVKEVRDFYVLYYDPPVMYKGQARSLGALNDLYRLTFEQIADLLEAQYISVEVE